ncbi:hypothetical protein KS964_004774 [Escherichia coli]|nr:hypothetical protein [Escherichia coli]EHR1025823.1 hypothetical protein [Escherichia coli]EHR1025836.1 hypothetical protein [Escherichia coli]
MTVTRQQSLAAMQAAARHVKGAGYQQGINGPGEIQAKISRASGEDCCR